MKLSIITINYNNLEGLKRTYESVVSQTCQDFEWIIIDGGSTDGSKEFIEEHQAHFAYWCSEPDKGIYNAMNKGIAKANGEYLQFLNSGDNLVDDKVIEEFFAFGWEEDVICGDIILGGNSYNIKCHPEDSELDFDYVLMGGFCHQAMFFKRNLHEKYGCYDETFNIVSDWKFALEVLMMHNSTYRHWKRFVVDYDENGISSIGDNVKMHLAERKRVLSNYKRIVRPIEKREKRIQELDLPVGVILKQRIINKFRKLFNRSV